MATAAKQNAQLIKRDLHLFSSSDDANVTKQILSTHSPNGRDIDVRPLLKIVEDVLQRSTPTVLVAMEAQLELVDDKMHHEGTTRMPEALAYTIHKISCEITCKCFSGGDAHATVMQMLHSLSPYTWDAKVVLALSAFAVAYGEFWLTAQLHSVNPLAKSVALLKQLPDILEYTNALKPRFDAVNNLITAMLNVTKCIIEFKELPSDYISPDSPDMSVVMAHIPTAVYWIIRSIIACASQIIGLIGLGHEYISATTEAWELSSLAHKLSNMHGHLTKLLSQCHYYIDEKRHSEAYETLVRLFDTAHLDNSKILKAMMCSKDKLPLIDGHAKGRVGVDVLRRKIVLLFITDIDVTPEELIVLTDIYNDTHQGKLERLYEIVWLPVIDTHVPWTPAKEELFDRTMPWYSLRHPSLLDQAVIKYIKDVWKFDKKPLLVVLDPQGKVVNPNALHMTRIWRSVALPFTRNREEALWKEEKWCLEFLIDEIDPAIRKWEAGIPLEMVYVGKSNPRERIRKAISVISAEKLSGYWQDPVKMWYFWVRLESMWHSKMQHGKTIENDEIMLEVMTMLSFDGSDEGWAVLSQGSLAMVKAHGKKIVDCLLKFDTWKEYVQQDGFIPALASALEPYHTPEHCTRIILPGETGGITEQVVCAECRKPMEKFVYYRCCND